MYNISVIGAGTMGNGIAHVFAQHGFSVQLTDLDEKQLEKAMSAISKNMDGRYRKAYYLMKRNAMRYFAFTRF
jgi:3-hydroxybutyryl-CoA dehydrogenase